MMTTVVDPRAMDLEPNTLAWLKTLETQGGPPIYTLSPTEARSVLVNLQSSAHIPPLPADSEDRIIRGGPIGEISLRIIRPPGVTSALPGIVYFHGGGWVLGDKETHDRLIRELANGAGATVVFVDYARSPKPDIRWLLSRRMPLPTGWRRMAPWWALTHPAWWLLAIASAAIWRPSLPC